MNNLPDFISVYNRFHNKDQFSNGDRAEIRRTIEPSDLETLPAFYKLLGNKLNKHNEKQWQRVIFFLVKSLEHSDNGSSLGKALKNSNKIKESRIFQVIRSEAPNSLIQLRRLIIHAQPIVNFKNFARQIWYWNKNSKKQLLKDFLIDSNSKTKKEKYNEQ